MKNTFTEKIEKFIDDNNMLTCGDSVVIGVSGGADSLALFTVLNELKDKYNLCLTVVHVHHGLRKEADEEEEYVKNICLENNISYVCKRFDCAKESKIRGLGLEETGRLVRYEAFNEVAGKNGKIAIAHNLNDRAETMLFHLCRGSGPRGLASIRAVSSNRIRPLLCVSRQEIEAYLQKKNIKFFTDASNREDLYTRNRIRNSILPLLNSDINKEATKHIATASLLIQQQSDFISELAKGKLSEIVLESSDESFLLPVSKFTKEHITLKREMIKQIIDALVMHNKDITLSHLESVIELIEKGNNAKLDLPYNLEVSISYDKVWIGLKKPLTEPLKIEYELDRGRYFIDGLGQCIVKIFPKDETFILCQKTYTKYFDYDKINSRLVLRNRQPRDYLTVTANMGKKKLKDYFIDIKMDSKDREKALLLADDSHILWVIGYRISEYYKVSEETQKIISIEIIPED